MLVRDDRLMVAVWVAQVLLQVDVAHAAHNPCGGWMPDDPHWLVDANCTPPPPYYPGPPGT